MKQAKFILLLLLMTSPLYAKRVASLPGGLMFPMFPIAALTNAAALTADWVTEADALYSPPLSSEDPHTYLFAVGS